YRGAFAQQEVSARRGREGKARQFLGVIHCGIWQTEKRKGPRFALRMRPFSITKNSSRLQRSVTALLRLLGSLKAGGNQTLNRLRRNIHVATDARAIAADGESKRRQISGHLHLEGQAEILRDLHASGDDIVERNVFFAESLLRKFFGNVGHELRSAQNVLVALGCRNGLLQEIIVATLDHKVSIGVQWA